jgi:hypothetical protein
LTCALALVPIEQANPKWAQLSVPFRGKPTLTAADLPRGLAQNPQAGLLDLIDVLRQSQSGSVRLDRGRGRGYCIEIVQPP